MRFALSCLACLFLANYRIESFQHCCSTKQCFKVILAGKGHTQPLDAGKMMDGEKYSNPIINLLSKGLISASKDVESKMEWWEEAGICWNSEKRRKTSPERLIRDLTKSLQERQWFVTGLIDPSYFIDEFSFVDPNVQVMGVKAYAEGVRKIFNPALSTAVIYNITQQPSNERRNYFSENNIILTVTWELNAVVNLFFGFRIQPYFVYSDLEVDRESGLIVSQVDRFSIPESQILIRSLFPSFFRD